MFLLTLNKMRHGTSVPVFHRTPIHHTRLMSLHMNKIIFCVQASFRVATNLWRTAQNMYPDVAVSLKFHILCHIHLDAHFGDVASRCWLLNGKLTLAYIAYTLLYL